MTGFKEVVVSRDLVAIREFLNALPESKFLDFGKDWVFILRDPENVDFVKTDLRADPEASSRISGILLSEIDGKTVGGHILSSTT